jgi:ATP-dependent RNA helicase RhlE
VVRKNLAKQGITTPTPVQAAAIPPAMAGNDVVATAQTGTGKTLAFCLPIIESLLSAPLVAKPQALILTPTRELALQIHEAFAATAQGTGIRAAVIVGGMSENAQLQAVRRGAQLLIATPGRLGDFLNRRLVNLETVRIVVLDEADRMLDMGFLPSVESILRKTAPVKQTLFFSATFESSAERLIDRYLKNPVRLTIGSTTKPPAEVEMHLYEVGPEHKLGLLKSLLDSGKGSFLVFARTKRGAERLAKKLEAEKVGSTAIHGDRSQGQRNRALAGFQNGEFRVLVATDVAARGIHVDGIAHVVNYDLPQSPEDFVHRVGRTGRAGASGLASTFATSAERAEVRAIEKAVNHKLTVRQVPEGLGAEAGVARIIVMPSRVRSFGPRGRRSVGRR